MSLSVLNIKPDNGSISIPIDAKVVIQFSEPVDKFTVENGINLYTSSSDDSVISPELKYEVENDTVIIYPITTLLPDKTYSVSLFPGNDVKRFVSARTTTEPTYTRISNSTGTISIQSAYKGTANGEYSLIFTGPTTFDVTFGIEYIGSFTYQGSNISIGNLTIGIDGVFEADDTVGISVFAASGLSSLYKITFTTNNYTTVLPDSTRVTDDDILDFEYQFKVVNCAPEINSVNNISCNPITIKFNKDISSEQDILNKLNIKRTDLVTGRVKTLKYKYKINKNILKIYLVSG